MILIVELAEAIMGVDPNVPEAPLLDKRKGKDLTVSTSKRSKKKAKNTSSAFLPSSGMIGEIWKPEFSTCELDKQVTVVDSTKNHDTGMALA